MVDMKMLIWIFYLNQKKFRKNCLVWNMIFGHTNSFEIINLKAAHFLGSFFLFNFNYFWGQIAIYKRK